MRLATIIFCACALGTGCSTDDYMRIEGMTPGAGNALAANTVMQMVDPWQPGVENTTLEVPADRSLAAEAATAGNLPVSGTSATTNN
jgi:hypothetical protein